MSQLNLKEILSGDTLSVLVDKINYNFDQITLNGGGPRGLRGRLGPPGLPGKQGIQGMTGPAGEDGTYLYVSSGATPGVYPFGTAGEALPRTYDVFLEADPTQIVIWQLAPTGSTGNYWKSIQTVQAPTGALSKLAYDQVSSTPTNTASVNDPAIAGKLLLGSPDALYGPSGTTGIGYIIDNSMGSILSPTPYLAAELSSPNIGFDSILTLASEQNQFRIINSDPDILGSSRLQRGGGILHSLSTTYVSGATVETYRIINGDVAGNKNFTVSLNSNASATDTLFYANTSHRIGFGVPEFTDLLANFTVKGSLAVGSKTTSFYLASAGATFENGLGIITEGNLAVGKNDNSKATGGFYNISGNFGSSVLIDTDGSIGSSDAKTSLVLGVGEYSNSTTSNNWKFVHDGYSSISNSLYRSLSLVTQQYGLTSGSLVSRTVMTFLPIGEGLTSGIKIGVDNTDSSSLFEIGSLPNRVSIGQVSGGISENYMSSYLSFNVLRNSVKNEWLRKGDGTNNSGKAIWTTLVDSSINFSFLGSTGGATASNTDSDIYSNTRTTLQGGSIRSGETFNPLSVTSSLGLLVGFSATGSTGTGFAGSNWRRMVASFGDGVSTGKKGSPSIYATNGITQSFSTLSDGTSVAPQYSFAENSGEGLYLSNNISVNGATCDVVGIAVGGTSAAVFTGATDGGYRIGFGQSTPLENVHFGEKLFISDRQGNDYKYIGYNSFFDRVLGRHRRIVGSTAGSNTRRGSARIAFTDNTLTTDVPASRFQNSGGKIALVVNNVGSTSTNDSNETSGRIYRGVIVSPPALAPNISGWVNYAPNVPQVKIGLSGLTASDEIEGSSLKRGTLAIAAQARIKPLTTGPFGLTIEDQYNIALYSSDGYPSAAMYGVGGNPSTTSTRGFGINLIGDNGSVLTEDAPVFYASSEINLSGKYSRVANFGDGFRLGVGAVPQDLSSTPAAANSYDIASLVVGGFQYSGLTGSATQAAIFRGNVILDHSAINDGRNFQGLYFRDNSITTISFTASAPVQRYAGDWFVGYRKVAANRAGLAFGKPAHPSGLPSAQPTLLWLDNQGHVTIGGYEGDFTSTTFAAKTDSSTGSFTSGSYSFTATLNVAGNGRLVANSIYVSSDRRMKENVSSLASSLDKVLSMNPVNFTWKESGIITAGFIAQEMEEIVPESVITFDDERYEGGRKSIEYNAIIPYAIAAIQEQNKIIEEKEQRIKELESKLSRIEDLLSKHNIV